LYAPKGITKTKITNRNSTSPHKSSQNSVLKTTALQLMKVWHNELATRGVAVCTITRSIKFPPEKSGHQAAQCDGWAAWFGVSRLVI
jgi:hypothetical protein